MSKYLWGVHLLCASRWHHKLSWCRRSCQVLHFIRRVCFHYRSKAFHSIIPEILVFEPRRCVLGFSLLLHLIMFDFQTSRLQGKWITMTLEWERKWPKVIFFPIPMSLWFTYQFVHQCNIKSLGFYSHLNHDLHDFTLWNTQFLQECLLIFFFDEEILSDYRKSIVSSYNRWIFWRVVEA